MLASNLRNHFAAVNGNQMVPGHEFIHELLQRLFQMSEMEWVVKITEELRSYLINYYFTGPIEAQHVLGYGISLLSPEQREDQIRRMGYHKLDTREIMKALNNYLLERGLEGVGPVGGPDRGVRGGWDSGSAARGSTLRPEATIKQTDIPVIYTGEFSFGAFGLPPLPRKCAALEAAPDPIMSEPPIFNEAAPITTDTAMSYPNLRFSRKPVPLTKRLKGQLNPIVPELLNLQEFAPAPGAPSMHAGGPADVAAVDPPMPVQNGYTGGVVARASPVSPAPVAVPPPDGPPRHHVTGTGYPRGSLWLLLCLHVQILVLFSNLTWGSSASSHRPNPAAPAFVPQTSQFPPLGGAAPAQGQSLVLPLPGMEAGGQASNTTDFVMAKDVQTGPQSWQCMVRPFPQFPCAYLMDSCTVNFQCTEI
eukprot:jgi/Botrbrau1/21376/Bobra.0653s0001.1